RGPARRWGGRERRQIMTIRQHTIFRGHVQGVGFRATTQRLAEGFDIAGFVRNLTDGSVELVAEGKDTEVKAFLEAVRDRMSGYVREATTTEQEAQGEQGFRVE